MEKKILIIFEILIVAGLFLFYTFKEVIPDYKRSIGSSDKFINEKIYKKMYEFNIDNKINFSIIIDENNKIYPMLFFNKESACLANKNIVLSKEESDNTKVYSDNIYNKITNYINMNNISNLDINDTTLVISMISADEEFTHYPSINSWYYVKDKKVYAYIEFVISDNKVKGYCYNGSIDLVKEGVC